MRLVRYCERRLLISEYRISMFSETRARSRSFSGKRKSRNEYRICGAVDCVSGISGIDMTFTPKSEYHLPV
jgi:hypothetical protein